MRVGIEALLEQAESYGSRPKSWGVGARRWRLDTNAEELITTNNNSSTGHLLEAYVVLDTMHKLLP